MSEDLSLQQLQILDSRNIDDSYDMRGDDRALVINDGYLVSILQDEKAFLEKLD